MNDMASLTYNGEVFEIPDITLSDEYLFEIFDFEFIEGMPDNALVEPNTMVITAEVARQIFGNETALGKKLNTIVREYTITGVIEQAAQPTSILTRLFRSIRWILLRLTG